MQHNLVGDVSVRRRIQEANRMNNTNTNQELRTSLTHPLHIDWISVGEENGRIGITLCPGKYQPISWTGGWNRDLELDIEMLVDSGVEYVISLVEEEEMVNLRVENLGESVRAKGMCWMHMPLTDTTAPERKWLDVFRQHSDSIRKGISSGKTVLVHCKGGLGRAGTCAALILFLQGFEMSDAIQLIRATRSNQCINPIQQIFLEKFAGEYKTLGFTKDTNDEGQVVA